GRLRARGAVSDADVAGGDGGHPGAAARTHPASQPWAPRRARRPRSGSRFPFAPPGSRASGRRRRAGRPRVSRRVRAIAFGCAALASAALAAVAAGGYRADLEGQLGPMRPVVVARAPIPARRALSEADAERLLEVRRIPVRFAPAGALSAPRQVI